MIEHEVFSRDEVVDIVTNIETGRYSSEAAFDTMQELIADLVGCVGFPSNRTYLKSQEVQILNNIILKLVSKIKQQEQQ